MPEDPLVHHPETPADTDIIWSDDRESARPAGKFVWWVVGTVVSITLVVAIAIGGAYAAALHAIDQQRADSRAQGIAICKALVTLDRSGDGVVFNKPGASEVVLERMLHGIHGVVVTSGCEKR